MGNRSTGDVIKTFCSHAKFRLFSDLERLERDVSNVLSYSQFLRAKRSKRNTAFWNLLKEKESLSCRFLHVVG